MEKKKVVVGMSGGVDSSVAAWLLKNQGYDVIGVTMQIWQDEEEAAMEEHGGCCGLSAVDDARRVAAALDIPYYVMNFKKEFKENVIDYFIDDYLHGRTPNPCIACNRYVKWESLLKRSLDIGAEYIATGHYARVEKLSNGRYAIRNSATAAKDQTYALYNLTQDQLSKTLMPVGEYTKDQIRAMADEIGLLVAHKPDSQDICFVPDGDYTAFIERITKNKPRPGKFIHQNGQVLGTHQGLIHYTIGQRKGLGIAYEYPLYVIDKDIASNTVILGPNDALFQKALLAENCNLIAIDKLEAPLRVTAKTRYRQKDVPAVIEPLADGKIKVTFDELQRAITPGQAVVFYDGDYVVGGGIIAAPLKE